MRGTQQASLLIGAVAIVATAACGNRGSDDDVPGTGLELAPRGGTAQTVVSAIESAPAASPSRAVRKPVTKSIAAPVAKPVSHPAPRRAAPERVTPAPRATVVETAPQETAPAPRKAEPDPLPPFPDAQGAGKARQQGSYGTEADIFRRMPWIRP